MSNIEVALIENVKNQRQRHCRIRLVKIKGDVAFVCWLDDPFTRE